MNNFFTQHSISIICNISSLLTYALGYYDIHYYMVMVVVVVVVVLELVKGKKGEGPYL